MEAELLLPAVGLISSPGAGVGRRPALFMALGRADVGAGGGASPPVLSGKTFLFWQRCRNKVLAPQKRPGSSIWSRNGDDCQDLGGTAGMASSLRASGPPLRFTPSLCPAPVVIVGPDQVLSRRTFTNGAVSQNAAAGGGKGGRISPVSASGSQWTCRVSRFRAGSLLDPRIPKSGLGGRAFSYGTS